MNVDTIVNFPGTGFGTKNICFSENDFSPIYVRIIKHSLKRVKIYRTIPVEPLLQSDGNERLI